MTVYFTSDWHLFHKNIIKYAHRPFENVIEMNDHILKEFKTKVKHSDTVYFLGDFAFSVKYRKEEIEEILKEVSNSCKFYAVLGNHDSQMEPLLREYCKQVELRYEIKIEKQRITLSHYPMHTYNYSYQNSWQLYGHHHRDTNPFIPGKRWNVSVDANNFKFLSFEELKEIMRDREDNWDFIAPENRNRPRTNWRKYNAKLNHVDQAISILKDRMKNQFTEKTPKEIIQKTEEKLKSYQRDRIEVIEILKKFENNEVA